MKLEPGQSVMKNGIIQQVYKEGEELVNELFEDEQVSHTQCWSASAAAGTVLQLPRYFLQQSLWQQHVTAPCHLLSLCSLLVLLLLCWYSAAAAACNCNCNCAVRRLRQLHSPPLAVSGSTNDFQIKRGAAAAVGANSPGVGYSRFQLLIHECVHCCIH